MHLGADAWSEVLPDAHLSPSAPYSPLRPTTGPPLIGVNLQGQDLGGFRGSRGGVRGGKEKMGEGTPLSPPEGGKGERGKGLTNGGNLRKLEDSAKLASIYILLSSFF